MPKAANLKDSFLKLVGLQTPVSRLAFFALITSVIYLVSFERLTGGPGLSLWAHLNIPSPSIGLTRAYWYVVHGDLASAWEMNRLIFPVIFAVLIIIIFDIRKLLVKKTPPK